MAKAHTSSANYNCDSYIGRPSACICLHERSAASPADPARGSLTSPCPSSCDRGEMSTIEKRSQLLWKRDVISYETTISVDGCGTENGNCVLSRIQGLMFGRHSRAPPIAPGDLLAIEHISWRNGAAIVIRLLSPPIYCELEHICETMRFCRTRNPLFLIRGQIRVTTLIFRILLLVSSLQCSQLCSKTSHSAHVRVCIRRARARARTLVT